MPGTMIHLLLAEKIHNDYPIEYYIGSFAPDTISKHKDYSWKLKDELHFRGIENRFKKLTQFAKALDMSIPYYEGYILHLFFDMHWDKDCLVPFIENHTNDDWFTSYRNEISLSSSWIFHNNKKINKRWKDVFNYNGRIQHVVQGISYVEIEEYTNCNNIWYDTNKIGPSAVFSNCFIEKYTDEIKEKYFVWREEMK
ncbi:MAG: hypothetical protein KAQ68_06965 [Clostridiales bacterium]|nr:hypothetical protein [Clostridiales bacterium]